MNKRKTKKVAKKTGARKPNTSKPFATSRELIKFRENVAKANKRIARLEKEGLEPNILSFVKSTLGERIHIPRGKALTEQVFNKIKAITERFLNAATSRLKAAREGEKKHREAFHEKIVRAFEGEIDRDLEGRLYYAIGDIDIKSLLNNYKYEEVLFAMQELNDIGITPTTSIIDKTLQTNISYVVEDELNARGIPTDGATLRDYVDIALQYGIEEAERQFCEDEGEEL